MKAKSKATPLIEEEEKPLPPVEVIITPDEVLTVLRNQNEFFASFLHTYNYKQKVDLRASRIMIIAEFTKGGPLKAGTVKGEFKMVVELEQTGEILVLEKTHGGVNEVDLKSPQVVEGAVKFAHRQLMTMMRHGLATVIRTAQKKGAEVIL
jgi:hypothetical protein